VGGVHECDRTIDQGKRFFVAELSWHTPSSVHL
jgi:hypothetical protein